jgi:hypothetical protein
MHGKFTNSLRHVIYQLSARAFFKRSILKKKIQRINGQLSVKGLEISRIVQRQELEGFSN